MKNNSKRSPWWKDLLLILFGAILAISGGIIQSYLENNFETKKIIENRKFESKVLLATLQSEIEANLIYLHNRYRKYEGASNNNLNIEIIQFKASDDVYRTNIDQLGKLNHLGLIAEIVSFYSGLQRLENWSEQIISKQLKQEEVKKYASQHANFLHAAIFLHARLSELTRDMPKTLTSPSFSQKHEDLLKSIKEFRKEIGVSPSL